MRSRRKRSKREGVERYSMQNCVQTFYLSLAVAALIERNGKEGVAINDKCR